MRIGVIYASTTGHAQNIAGFAAGVLRAAGHEVGVSSAAQTDAIDPAGCTAVLLVGSLRLGRFQAALRAFARRHHRVLNTMPSALLSVSLSAAGGTPEDLAALDGCVQRFEQATLWQPTALHHVGGALSFSKYGPLTRLAIRAIARRRGMNVDGHTDYDLTDYPALEAFLDGFIAGVGRARREHGAAAHGAGGR